MDGLAEPWDNCVASAWHTLVELSGSGPELRGGVGAGQREKLRQTGRQSPPARDPPVETGETGLATAEALRKGCGRCLGAVIGRTTSVPPAKRLEPLEAEAHQTRGTAGSAVRSCWRAWCNKRSWSGGLARRNVRRTSESACWAPSTRTPERWSTRSVGRLPRSPRGEPGPGCLNFRPADKPG